jgi:hypothetical protein
MAELAVARANATKPSAGYFHRYGWSPPNPFYEIVGRVRGLERSGSADTSSRASRTQCDTAPVHSRTGKHRRGFEEPLLAALTNHTYPPEKRIVYGGGWCFNPDRGHALVNVFLTCHAHTGSDGKTFRRGSRPTRFYIGSFAQNRIFGVERPHPPLYPHPR